LQYDNGSNVAVHMRQTHKLQGISSAGYHSNLSITEQAQSMIEATHAESTSFVFFSQSNIYQMTRIPEQ